MPKFPGLSGTETVRALEKLGFVVAWQSESHRVHFDATKCKILKNA
jgi:predicted RNA binding protein YcfA (HicA-like mRNA interferase family)